MTDLTHNPTLTLVQFPHESLLDIPAGLRRLMEDLCAGRKNWESCVVIGVRPKTDRPQVFGFGRRVTPNDALAYVTHAQAFLCSGAVARVDDDEPNDPEDAA